MSEQQSPQALTGQSAGQRIREERELRGWSQHYVATQIGADRYYLSRWEHGKMLPSPYYREKLCALFGKNARELGFLGAEAHQETETPEIVSPIPSMVQDPSIPPLPNTVYTLVGRQEQLTLLKRRLCSATPSTVLALNGLPGVGKTALAVALAHDNDVLAHFHDGILWAGVGKNPDVIGILSRWGTLLGISPVEASKLTTHQAWAQAIRAAIGSRRLLIVVDDIWTLEAFTSLQIGGHTCVYVLTTRFPQLAWHAAANGTFPIAELNEADSILFLERLAPLVMQQEPTIGPELARLVGGLPLALVLMGNFLRVQTYNGQLRRVRQAIERLRTVEMRLNLQEPQAMPQRSPSMAQTSAVSVRTLVAVSDQQLDTAAREALYALSVFPAKPTTFSEEAALAVCQSGPEVLDTLSDMGLLESYAPDRYALHQIIADYAALQRSDMAPLERFTRFIASYVQQHTTDYPSLERERSTILAALHLASKQPYPEHLIDPGNRFAAFLSMRGSYTEAIALLEHVCLAASTLQDPQGLTTALYHLGDIAMNQGEYARAYDVLQQGLALSSRLSELPLRCQLLRLLGSVEGYQGNYAQAEQHLQEALTLARRLQDDELLSIVLRSTGAIASDQSKFDDAQTYCEEGLILARRLQKPDLTCSLLVNLDQIALLRGHYAEAEGYAQEALEIAIQIGFRSAHCLLQAHLGIAALEQGKYAQAREPLEQALELARTLSHREYLVGALANLGRLLIKQHEYAQAQPYLEEGLVLARAMESPWLLAGMLDEWGEFCLAQANWANADTAYAEMYHMSQQISREYEALALYGKARVARARNALPEARQLGQSSLAILHSLEHHRTHEVEQWLASQTGAEF